MSAGDRLSRRQANDPKDLPAIHEAAHAVVAAAMGYRVTSVTVDNDGLGGCCGYSIPVTERGSPAGTWRELSVTFAGGLAEGRLLGEDWRERTVEEVLELYEDPYLFDDDEWQIDDFVEAARLARGMVGVLGWGDPREEITAAIESAYEVLNEQWSEVETLAETLIQPRR